MDKKTVQPATAAQLADAIVYAWNAAMDDPEIPEPMKVKFAIWFIGVPEMALEMLRYLPVGWPHPVEAKAATG